MRKILVPFALALSLVAISPALASVTYTFSDGPISFTYASSGFITTAQTIDASALSSCTVGFGTSCDTIDFRPDASFGLSSFDVVQVNTVFFGFPLSISDSFAQGAFSAPGSYTSFTDGSLVVSGSPSTVPLPPSAPMFGAAILALGALGYGLKRNMSAVG